LNKAHGGEARGLREILPIYDFKDCDKIKADLVIVLSGGQEQADMIEHLPKLDCMIAWWMCDFRNPEHFGSTMNQICDYMFVPYLNYHKGFQRLSKKGVYYLPQSGYKWKDYEINYEELDAVFIGNTKPNKYHNNRIPILKEINKNCNLAIIEDGITTVEQSSFYAKVPLSIAISSNEIIGGCSNRLYNILKAGGCALVRYFEGIEDLFTNHEHLIWFKEVHELEHLIKYYLSNPEEIERIKHNAKKEADEKHSISSRIVKIVKTIKENE
jgi:hypothetical protein